LLILSGVKEIELKEKQMDDRSDRRKFDRFPMEFILEVIAKDSKGNKFTDITALKNISGESAKFITRQTNKYFPGQSLELNIFLPGTNDVKAQMRGKASVVRIGTYSNKDIEEESGVTGIALILETPLSFERVDKKTGGE